MVFIISLILISSLKNEETSSDTKNYIISYNKAPPISQFVLNNNYWLEPGYRIVQSLCKQFTDLPFLHFFIISVISICLYGFIIWNYSPYPFLSLFLYLSIYFLTREMIVIRYGCSSAIMLLSLIYYSKSKIFISFLIAIIASLFHYSALTYILFLILAMLFSKFNKIKIMENIVFLGFVFSILGFSLVNIGIILFSSGILPIYFNAALSKGMNYLEESSRGYKAILMYLPFIYFYKKSSKNVILKKYFFIFLFALFMMIEFTLGTMGRIGSMYMTIIVVFLPILLSKVQRKYYQLTYIYSIVYALYMFVRISFFNAGGAVVRW
jgi:hypothetical protein